MKRNIIHIIVLGIMLLSACKTKDTVAPEVGKFSLAIQTSANDTTFELNKAFATIYGDSLWCETLNYFITNIKLKRKGSQEYVSYPDYYFLFRQSDLTVPTHEGISEVANAAVGEFDLISFNIGIPLEKNRVPNTPTAAIATANSMYWEAWTEHIFFRFEGKFGAQKKAFLYHVTGDENLKTVIIDLKNNPLKVAVGARAKVVLKFHVDKVFSALDKIDVNISNNHMSGPVVARMANNYAKCFSLISVE